MRKGIEGAPRGEQEIVESIDREQLGRETQQRERSLLDRFRGRSREIAGVMMFWTAITANPAFAKEGHGEDLGSYTIEHVAGDKIFLNEKGEQTTPASPSARYEGQSNREALAAMGDKIFLNEKGEQITPASFAARKEGQSNREALAAMGDKIFLNEKGEQMTPASYAARMEGQSNREALAMGDKIFLNEKGEQITPASLAARLEGQSNREALAALSSEAGEVNISGEKYTFDGKVLTLMKETKESAEQDSGVTEASEWMSELLDDVREDAANVDNGPQKAEKVVKKGYKKMMKGYYKPRGKDAREGAYGFRTRDYSEGDLRFMMSGVEYLQETMDHLDMKHDVKDIEERSAQLDVMMSDLDRDLRLLLPKSESEKRTDKGMDPKSEGTSSFEVGDPKPEKFESIDDILDPKS